MIIKSFLSFSLISIFWYFCAESRERAELVVAQDGSGMFYRIQDAIDAVPANNRANKIILIRKGVYNEKLYITKSFLTLVGEDRDSTEIVFPILRKNWNKEHDGTDWGAAVVNIDSLATDVIIANLTIRNNYGSLYGDRDHQFTIRGGGTRVIILCSNIISDGGDALSLWNKIDGMYYHAHCYFEGWVDYVCPRGWCYITDCRFYGHNLSASIWHDGSINEKQKFVIRYSFFDGVKGFPLGRHHRDGQIFLLDCIFSRNMADIPIYWPTNSPTTWKWGERHYYYNCHREGGDYEWFRDNIKSAEGAPSPSQINALWTFDGKWDPEETMPSVLPFVFLPKPRDGEYNVKKTVQLKWIPSRNSEGELVYFGSKDSLEFKGKSNKGLYELKDLNSKTKYYWRIDEVVGKDTINGPVWHFTTE